MPRSFPQLNEKNLFVFQIPWLDVIFNSVDPLPARLKLIRSQEETFDEEPTSPCYDDDERTPHHLSPEHYQNHHHHHQQQHGQMIDFPSWSSSSKLPPKRTGSDSPLSDSGCTSESHDELSLASLNSTHSSPFLRSDKQPMRGGDETAPVRPLSLGRSASVMGQFDQPTIRLRRQVKTSLTSEKERPTSTFGRLTTSLKDSIIRFADKSEWKMEAVVAKQREARAMLLLNETQAEVSTSGTPLASV